jgi:hypothetical protein
VSRLEDQPLTPTRQPGASRALACVAWILAVASYSVAQNRDLLYQLRGNHSEGLRTILVSGYDLELLSALVEPTSAAEAKPASTANTKPASGVKAKPASASAKPVTPANAKAASSANAKAAPAANAKSAPATNAKAAPAAANAKSAPAANTKPVSDGNAKPAPDANAKAASAGWADSVHLRFYLPEDEKVFITVRQLRSGTSYYWLNNVKGAFRTRAVNEYEWPTKPVLRQLTNVGLDLLGATVRVGQEEPAKSERVLPAVLFDTPVGTVVEAYRFVFKTNSRASIVAKIYSGEEVVFTRRENTEDANSPFTVRWEGGNAPDGWYRLVLSGYFKNTNTPLDKEVRFYHRRNLSR